MIKRPIAFIQPAVPHYREEFFIKLAALLEEYDVTVEVYLAEKWTMPYIEFDSKTLVERETINGFSFEADDIKKLIEPK